VRGAWDGDEEARAIGEEIEQAQRAGPSLNDMAILVRASFQMREFEDRFVTLGLPTASSAARAFTSAGNPRCAGLSARHHVSPTTTSPSSASSTRPSAASANDGAQVHDSPAPRHLLYAGRPRESSRPKS
jgi:hypothetical protein